MDCGLLPTRNDADLRGLEFGLVNYICHLFSELNNTGAARRSLMILYNPLAYLLEHVRTPAPSRRTPKGWHHRVCVEEDTCVALAPDTKGLASLLDDDPVIASCAGASAGMRIPTWCLLDLLRPTVTLTIRSAGLHVARGASALKVHPGYTHTRRDAHIWTRYAPPPLLPDAPPLTPLTP